MNDKVKGVQLDFMARGKIDGQKVLAAEGGAFKVTREVLLGVALELGYGLGMNDGKPHLHCRDWLDGYKTVMGDTRASEAKAIMIASTIGNKEMVVGTRKGDKDKGEDETKDYTNKETHTGLEWLNMCRSYGELVKVAKEVKGKDARGGGQKVSTELTGAKLDAAEKLVADASPNQAAQIVQKALGKIQGGKDGEKMLIHQIIGIAIRLEHSKDEAVKMAAHKIAEVAQDIVGRIAIAETKSGLAASSLSVPQPAVAPQAQAVGEERKAA